MFAKTAHVIFWFVAGLHLVAIAAGQMPLLVITKPLLLPLLLLYFWQRCPHPLQRCHYLVLAAGLFSCAGDTLLLFEHRHALFFMGGLGSFLVAHLLYTACFAGLWRKRATQLTGWVPLVMLTYAGGLFWLLQPGLGDLQVPVAVYALAIAAMLISSVHGFAGQSTAAVYSIGGAVLFVLSDSLLALNKFYHPFAGAHLLIMSTYIAAQWGIVKGMTIVTEAK